MKDHERIAWLEGEVRRLAAIVEAAPVLDLRAALREAIGTTDAGEGLPHWHHASGGTGPDADRDGVFVDRRQVLDAIDEVLP